MKFLIYLSLRSSILSRGTHWVSFPVPGPMTIRSSSFFRAKYLCTGLVQQQDRIPVTFSEYVWAPYRTCPDLWHTNGQIASGGYKMGSPPPTLGWPLRWLENTLNQNFFSSNSLSLKLHSNPSLLGEIWANSWVTHSIFKQEHFTNNLCVFITLRDSSPRRTRYPLIATKVVVSFKRFVLLFPSWGFDSEKLN
jgi:hypothetical protein